MENRFNYFYASENEQYLFLQMPLMLIKDERFKGLSDSAKILYSLLLNRTSLSAKNGWFDDEGRVYIIYTIKEVEEDLNCCEQKALKSMKELKEIGLIETIRRGLTKPNIIYVKNFGTELKYETKENKPKNPIKSLNHENHDTETVKITEQEQLNSRASNINSNKNNFINTDISIYPTGAEMIDMIDTTEIENISEAVADKICLEELKNEYPDKEPKIMELYQSICDVLAGDKAETIRIAKKQLPIATVKQAFASLGKAHILYVLGCLEKNGNNINNNAKGYIITALYNSIHSIGYYKPQNQSAFSYNSNSKPKVKYDDEFITKLVKKSLRF